MDVSRRRRASVDSILQRAAAIEGSDADVHFASLRNSTRKTVSLTLCVISTEDFGSLAEPRQENQPRGEEARKQDKKEKEKKEETKKKRDESSVREKKKSPIEKFRQKCDKLESLLHWGRAKKDKKSMSPPPPPKGSAGARADDRPPSPPSSSVRQPARPPSPPLTSSVARPAPPSAVGHVARPPSPSPAPERPSRPASLSLPHSQMVIGGSSAPETRRGSVNQVDLLHDLPDGKNPAFKALDQGPHLRPYAVGAPLAPTNDQRERSQDAVKDVQDVNDRERERGTSVRVTPASGQKELTEQVKFAQSHEGKREIPDRSSTRSAEPSRKGLQHERELLVNVKGHQDRDPGVPKDNPIKAGATPKRQDPPNKNESSFSLPNQDSNSNRLLREDFPRKEPTSTTGDRYPPKIETLADQSQGLTGTGKPTSERGSASAASAASARTPKSFATLATSATGGSAQTSQRQGASSAASGLLPVPVQPQPQRQGDRSIAATNSARPLPTAQGSSSSSDTMVLQQVRPSSSATTSTATVRDAQRASGPVTRTTSTPSTSSAGSSTSTSTATSSAVPRGGKMGGGRVSSGSAVVSFAGEAVSEAAGRGREPPRPRSPYPRDRGHTPPPRSRTPTPPPPPPRPRTPTPFDVDAASSSSSSCHDQGNPRRRTNCTACIRRDGVPGECGSCKAPVVRTRSSSKDDRKAPVDQGKRRSNPSPTGTASTSPRSSARSAPNPNPSASAVAPKRASSASPARRRTATAGQNLRNSLVHMAARNSQSMTGPPPSRGSSGRNSPRVHVGHGTHSDSTLTAHSPVAAPLSPGWDVVALEMEVLGLRRELQARRAEELRLRREIHKLRSVLQQATSFSQDADAREEPNECLLTSLQARHTMAGGRAVPAGVGGVVCTATGTSSVPAPSSKKQGVSGESSDPGSSAVTQTTFPKDFRSQQLIKASILDNDFLKNLSRGQIRELVDCMYPQSVTRGSYVIREGEAGCHLYVLAEGEMEVLKEGTVLGRTGPGKAFGELAILYNCTRTASIRAVTDLQVWVLDRKVFQQIMMRTGIQRIEENLSFLSSVPLLKNLSESTLHKIADVLEVEFYPAGSYIVRQGATGHTFFIISGGKVQVTQRVPGTTDEVVIRTLGRGDYFGEQALLHDDFRTASVVATAPGVECLTLDRESFLSLIGSLSELQEKDYGDTISQISRTSSSYSVLSDLSQLPLSECEVDLLGLEDLQVVGTLGVGGFGSVRLVVAPLAGSTAGRSYALKCLNKNHIVATGQQEHVLGEKDILLAVHCPFIVRLYRTFRDDHCVYMLLEACLGGELWSMLRERGSLDEEEARFAVACVVQAVEYLHARRIIYRDLKPENLVLDARGYVKLVDFGFAKRLGGSNKTWTFCGTPEYVAPEVILNRGHDRAVDCWAIGVLIFELLTGAPPFTAADPMRTYNLILKGIEAVAMPRAVGRSASHLIRRLCRAVPAERLGYQRAGLHDVRQQKWFQGFDWDGLSQQTLQPPIVPQVSGPTDMSNFDACNKEEDMASTEFSLWEADF